MANDRYMRCELTADEQIRLECARMVVDRHSHQGENAERAQEIYNFVAGGKEAG